MQAIAWQHALNVPVTWQYLLETCVSFLSSTVTGADCSSLTLVTYVSCEKSASHMDNLNLLVCCWPWTATYTIYKQREILIQNTNYWDPFLSRKYHLVQQSIKCSPTASWFLIFLLSSLKQRLRISRKWFSIFFSAQSRFFSQLVSRLPVAIFNHVRFTSNFVSSAWVACKLS